MLDFQKYLALLVAIAAIFSGLLSPVLGFDLAFGSRKEEEQESEEKGSIR